MLGHGVQLDDWLYGNLCRMSYTLRYREELYKLVTQGDTTFIESWKQQIVSVQNTRAKIANEEIKPEEPVASVLSAGNLPPILTKPISIHPYNEIYLDKLCELAARHGIRIVWLTLPIPELLAKRIPEKERTAVYSDFIARMSAKHKNLFPISPSISTYPDRYYRDPWHLNAYGSWIFSQKTGQQLAEWLKQNPLN